MYSSSTTWDTTTESSSLFEAQKTTPEMSHHETTNMEVGGPNVHPIHLYSV